MPATCCVKGCGSQSDQPEPGKHISFHHFPIRDPKHAKRMAIWRRAVGRPDFEINEHTVICSKHFLPSDFKRDLQQELMPDPTRKKRRKTELKEGVNPRSFQVWSSSMPSTSSIGSTDSGSEPTTGVSGGRKFSIRRAQRAQHREVGQ
jgi:hypothetical protein